MTPDQLQKWHEDDTKNYAGFVTLSATHTAAAKCVADMRTRIADLTDDYSRSRNEVMESLERALIAEARVAEIEQDKRRLDAIELNNWELVCAGASFGFGVFVRSSTGRRPVAEIYLPLRTAIDKAIGAIARPDPSTAGGAPAAPAEPLSNSKSE